MRYKLEWKLTPADPKFPTLEGGGCLELDQDETGILPDDMSNEHPMFAMLSLCGPAPVILLCRERGGERFKMPTIEFLTKASRQRRRSQPTV